MPERPEVPDDPAERVRIKRAYRAGRVSDGKRILIDRLWPRGVSKDRAKLFAWEKEIAPSEDLRHWFHENPDQFVAFGEKYRAELDAVPEVVDRIAGHTEDGMVSLIYAAKDEDHNNAVVLRDYLRDRLRNGDRE